MISTGKTLGRYAVSLDRDGNEMCELAGPVTLPASYAEREIQLAEKNLSRGRSRVDLVITRTTLHLTVQRSREAIPDWGDRFKKDPRRFGSLPRPGVVEVRRDGW
ncbi:hypothetical protein AKJ09_00060 [Labilithrix luteola]|uniref:Uncharacterized protein n=1 Tax=Labilithrix luteola TaxID=1391654 RepID=A0A0K1PJ23_9BACT|nr:hypothetical protein [Labilithrix luteola]AKU93396.1 hypothetical protein AKJ09_00060 [Labilithrix luteola]